jgi:hypothetical protein
VITEDGELLRSFTLVLICGRWHLERVLQTYVAHYVQERPHRVLGLAVPASRPNTACPGDYPNAGRTKDVLGSLIHEYRWAALSGNCRSEGR